MNMKKIFTALLALVLSSFLILSIPIINYLLKQGLSSKKIVEVAKVSLKKVELHKKKKKPVRRLRKPRRQKPARTKLKAGPRFGMDLGVMGTMGVAVDVNTIKAGSGSGTESGDVDERPSQNFDPEFKLPSAVKEAGINARVVLSFCVDANGHAYEIQVVDESPSGLGMAQSARQALKSTTYSPAKKEGHSVSFCGMEQPFEVKFD